MPDADVDAATVDVQEQARWGETASERATRRLTVWARRAHQRIDDASGVIQDLRQTVRELGDRITALETSTVLADRIAALDVRITALEQSTPPAPT